MNWRAKHAAVEAVQFDPHTQPWPRGVNPWPDEKGYTPRDTSWGYLETRQGRVHVHTRDWIVTDASGFKEVWLDRTWTRREP